MILALIPEMCETAVANGLSIKFIYCGEILSPRGIEILVLMGVLIIEIKTSAKYLPVFDFNLTSHRSCLL